MNSSRFDTTLPEGTARSPLRLWEEGVRRQCEERSARVFNRPRRMPQLELSMLISVHLEERREASAGVQEIRAEIREWEGGA